MMFLQVSQMGGFEWMFVTPLFILLIIFVVLCFSLPFHVRVIRKECEKTNKLLRQLIKAYGHDPEA